MTAVDELVALWPPHLDGRSLRITAEDYYVRWPLGLTLAVDCWLYDTFGEEWDQLGIVKLWVREGPQVGALCETLNADRTGWDKVYRQVEAPYPFPLHAWMGLA